VLERRADPLYGLRDDGRIDVVNSCVTSEGVDEARGVARLVDPATSARLKVRFAPAFLTWLPFVWGDYWVLGRARALSAASPHTRCAWWWGQIAKFRIRPHFGDYRVRAAAF
jgi:lipocalin